MRDSDFQSEQLRGPCLLATETVAETTFPSFSFFFSFFSFFISHASPRAFFYTDILSPSRRDTIFHRAERGSLGRRGKVLSRETRSSIKHVAKLRHRNDLPLPFCIRRGYYEDGATSADCVGGIVAASQFERVSLRKRLCSI